MADDARRGALSSGSAASSRRADQRCGRSPPPAPAARRNPIASPSRRAPSRATASPKARAAHRAASRRPSPSPARIDVCADEDTASSSPPVARAARAVVVADSSPAIAPRDCGHDASAISRDEIARRPRSERACRVAGATTITPAAARDRRRRRPRAPSSRCRSPSPTLGREDPSAPGMWSPPARAGGFSVSVGGGAFLPLEGVDGCPSLAAADDGTLAIVGSGQEPAQMVVGRLGAFSAPIPLDGSDRRPEPRRGAWRLDRGRLGHPRRARDAAVTLLVVAPDGRQTRTVLERTRSDFVVAPLVGIGPAGDVDGALVAIEPPFLAAAGRARQRGRSTRRQRPAGRAEPALLRGAVRAGRRAERGDPARVGDGGRRASAGGRRRAGPGLALRRTLRRSRRRSTTRARRSSPTATRRARWCSSTALPAAAWAVPRVLGDVAIDPYASASPSSPPIRGSVLAADGRAVVVWADTREGQLSVTAANGRAGGPWSGPAALSAITRDGVGPSRLARRARRAARALDARSAPASAARGWPPRPRTPPRRWSAPGCPRASGWPRPVASGSPCPCAARRRATRA